MEGRDNQESELEEEIEHTSEEERDEVELPLTPNTIPPQDPLYEVELAQIFANMSEYIQPESLLNLNVEAEKSEENNAHNRTISGEIVAEVETRAETTQEKVDQTRVTSPEEPS